ncbi:hypothetical protein Sgleb_71700 [Streptomyces glebosus]|uniref:Uncharacterized protein n=1 Tax=Streptomyces glebosus TaxID=249580 RepID=A0A640T5Y1_9ACTN|nr:hypothetical protein Sgleb_71700 [Streptomyces glebosus]GHG77489.1 hypothetical protein GCM10010513_53210 [Streptomyces glebosus]
MTTQTPLRGPYPRTSALRVPLASLTDVRVLVPASLCGGGNGGVRGASSAFIFRAPRPGRSKGRAALSEGDLGAMLDELQRKNRLTETDERRTGFIPMVNKGRRKADT